MTADLIARLEAAERGSRELDAAVLRAARFKVIGGQRGWLWSDGKIIIKPGSSRVSRSIDAIAALTAEKLPGWSGTIDIVRSDRADGKFSAEIRPLGAEIGEEMYCSGNKPALAFCIALLRALERIER